MLDINATDRLCITGLPRSGKTYMMRFLTTFPEPRIYIIDPLNQYEEFGDVGDVLAGGKRWVPKQETPQELELICKKLYQVSNMTLIVEEAEQYFPQGRAMLPYTSGLIRMGRNWGIGIWATTRRIQDINKRFFDLAQHVIFFRCGLKSRDYIADLIGKEYMYPTLTPKYNKTGHTLTTLPPFAFLHFNLETEEAEVLRLKLGATPRLEPIVKESKRDKQQINE